MLAIPTELSLTNPPDAGVADSPPDHSDPLEVPESLKTPAFMARWAQWQTHRRAFKKPKDWVAMFREQLDWLAQYPADVATEMLSQSIRNGWQGLFETNHNRNGNHHRSVAEERNSFIGQPGCEDDSADVPFV